MLLTSSISIVFVVFAFQRVDVTNVHLDCFPLFLSNANANININININVNINIISQMSDGEPWGWFDEMEEVGGEAGGGAPAATPVTKPTPPYILTVRLSLGVPPLPATCFRNLTRPFHVLSI